MNFAIVRYLIGWMLCVEGVFLLLRSQHGLIFFV